MKVRRLIKYKDDVTIQKTHTEDNNIKIFVVVNISAMSYRVKNADIPLDISS